MSYHLSAYTFFNLMKGTFKTLYLVSSEMWAIYSVFIHSSCTAFNYISETYIGHFPLPYLTLIPSFPTLRQKYIHTARVN